jgi:hypothetical protein
MNDNSTFRLSFRVRHPTLAASEIAKAFDLPITKLFQSVGEQRMTPSGEILEGIYKKTGVGFEFHEHALRFDEVRLEDMILEQLEKIDLKYTAHLVDTGGHCEFFIGIFPDSNVGLELGNAVNDLLSVSKIELSFDIYGSRD